MVSDLSNSDIQISRVDATAEFIKGKKSAISDITVKGQPLEIVLNGYTKGIVSRTHEEFTFKNMFLRLPARGVAAISKLEDRLSSAWYEAFGIQEGITFGRTIWGQGGDMVTLSVSTYDGKSIGVDYFMEEQGGDVVTITGDDYDEQFAGCLHWVRITTKCTYRLNSKGYVGLHLQLKSVLCKPFNSDYPSARMTALLSIGDDGVDRQELLNKSELERSRHDDASVFERDD
jgi:hypothetical protein